MEVWFRWFSLSIGVIFRFHVHFPGRSWTDWKNNICTPPENWKTKKTKVPWKMIHVENGDTLGMVNHQPLIYTMIFRWHVPYGIHGFLEDKLTHRGVESSDLEETSVTIVTYLAFLRSPHRIGGVFDLFMSTVGWFLLNITRWYEWLNSLDSWIFCLETGCCEVNVRCCWFNFFFAWSLVEFFGDRENDACVFFWWYLLVL